VVLKMNIRINQVQEKMKEKNIAAAVFKLPENVVLFSHYLPRNGFSFVFVPAVGEPVVIAPYGDQTDPEEGIITKIIKFGWVKVTDGNPYENVQKILTNLKEEYKIKDNAKIGTDINSDVIAPCLCAGEIMLPGKETQRIIKAAFNTEDISDINGYISELRMIKIDTEIEKIEIANEIGWMAIEKFTELVKEKNIREIDIAAEVEAFVAKKASGYKGAKYGKAFAQVTSGPERTAAAWFAGMVTTDRVLQNGDFVMIEMGTMVDGFWCDLTKTIVYGNASEEQNKILAAVEKAQKLALAAIKEGVTTGEVDKIARDYIAGQGYGKDFVHNLGHGVGITYHDGEPFYTPDGKMEVKAGMIHSCEPGIYIDGIGGVRQECNVLVLKDGAKILGK
jgi:Xaa-Pro aminopeptidase